MERPRPSPTRTALPGRCPQPDDGVLPMNTHPLLEELDAEDDIGVFRLLGGVLSTEAAQAVCRELSRLATETGRTRLPRDFGGVEYLGAPGLAEFLALHAQLRAAGGGLRLCDAEGCVDLDRLSDFPIGKGQLARTAEVRQ